MKKINLIISLALFLTTLSVVSANALDVTKAKEFMSVDMYSQAIALLEKQLKDKPTDAETHYQLGICFSNTGNFSDADKHFASAVKPAPIYKDKIAAEYERIGFEALQNGNTMMALKFFQTAIKYQPDSMDRIAQDAFSQGEAFFDQNNYKLADSTFSVAITFDSTLKQPASDTFFDLGNSVEDSSCIEYYRTARKYSSVYNHEIGQRLVQLAEDPMISETDRQKYSLEASSYLKDTELAELFPLDYEMLEMEEKKIVNLPDGSPPEKYFRLPGTTNTFEVSWNNLNTHFELKTRSGRIITIEEIKKGNFFVNERDFMVVPTINKLLYISIRPVRI